MKWISTEDHLPEKGRFVLVDGGIAYYDQFGLWMSVTAIAFPGQRIQWKVTHWMPLPELPK
jgi:hypothetical protein